MNITTDFKKNIIKYYYFMPIDKTQLIPCKKVTKQIQKEIKI